MKNDLSELIYKIETDLIDLNIKPILPEGKRGKAQIKSLGLTYTHYCI